MSPDYFGKLRALGAGTLDPGDFSHLDHIGVAYEALSRHDFFEAASGVAAGIRGLAERAGASDKFNATITWAYLSLIAERMRTTEHSGAVDFIMRNPDIVGPGALAPWYSKQRLTSDLARSTVLLPDQPPADSGQRNECGQEGAA